MSSRSFPHECLDWLVHIVNMSLSTGIFPEPLKTAIVKPLLKKPTLNCTSFRNFRPVSNISFMSKVIEKVIAFQFHSHMTWHNLFEELQSAYKAHHSTETTLVKRFNDIILNVESGSGSFLLLLDLSSNFDTIDYDLLCSVFEHHLGISGTALKLLKSFLTGRSQAVIINGVKSELKKLTCGVPQGSVLRPLEFCNYLIPLGNILKYHNVQYHMYTQVYISFKLKTPHEAVDTISECISDLRTWMINHKLKINNSKTEFLIIRSQFSKVTLPKLTVTVGDTEISYSDEARNLGVNFDSFMNLEPHIPQVCRVAYMHLRNVRKIRNTLTDKAASQLIHAFVTSRIDYCISILTLLILYLISSVFKTQLHEF